jgi:hypothetical protein
MILEQTLIQVTILLDVEQTQLCLLVTQKPSISNILNLQKHETRITSLKN